MTADERELRIAWQRHIGTGATADAWFDTVLAAHRGADRHYHGVRHVRWVVHHCHELADGVDPPLSPSQIDEIVAAGFFHDLVYDARRGDNEEASARRAGEALAEIGWPDAAVDRVAAMVEATAGHDVTDDTDNTDNTGDPRATAIVLAADLGVLATEPGRYGDYVRAVRREYAHIDDLQWRAGRTVFVRDMLERDHIFPTSLGLDAWERRARANLTAELAALTAES